MRLLFVHGRSQGGKNPETLKGVWLEALGKGLHRAGLKLPSHLEVAFPFYGDRLDKFVADFELPADPAVVPKGAPVFDDYAAFRAEVAEEMRKRASISDAEVRAEVGEQLPTEKGAQNWAWVQAIIRLLDRNLVAVSDGTIEVFLRDVFLYSRRKAVQTQIDAIVAKELTDDTTVVVGHSLGSVVAYNVLRSRAAKVPLFVTVGSPLGIRAIRSSLAPLVNSAGERGWYNAYDPRDVVSLYPLDAGNFNVDPAIENNGKVDNWTENRHGIIGYLDDPHVAKVIVDGISQ
ncbi:hypothetical protein [Rhizobium leguminosarum]|uniref:hypothetical protein n=1 Tax=Rhizobium leguminosarum TaxID=384 RepID=UPI001C966D29|nr:hypothetical protein [Rhizobium leguminosarum]MBY5666858.1 alpha/beta hydrolase [Rhizobium leguminosarum]MBY5680479.1 alpha/beta hydrolase [Rhizobium leguminosarum]